MSKKSLIGIANGLTITLLVMVAAIAQGAGDKAYTCFPTCSETDGRMLTLAGSGLFTMGNDSVSVRLVIPGSEATFDIGVFDGDSGPPHWDRGIDELVYRLFADPSGDGTDTILVAQWYSNRDQPTRGPAFASAVSGAPSGRMPDNDWFDITVGVSVEALAVANSECPAGDYCYRLTVESTRPKGYTESNFKIRSTGQISLGPEAFLFVGAVRGYNDLSIIYPQYPSFVQTTYDGSWEFVLQLDQPASSFTVWDGDFDYGSYDCVLMDTDDADTCANLDSNCIVNSADGSSLVPPWADGTAAYTQGVAYGNIRACGQTTGMPNDDQDPLLMPDLPGVFTRSPAVRYELETPVGTFTNLDPSGNQEWEQFRLDTNPAEPADYLVPQVPAGEYRLRVFGLDAANLNALRVSAVTLGCPSGSLGGRIWSDRNTDGMDDPAERGINGVEVRLYRETKFDGTLKPNQDKLIAVQRTSGDGNYNFLGLGAGNYWVEVVESTLPPGAVLTTANQPFLPPNGYALAESQLLDQADFGYLLGAISGVVWNDNNQDGIFQANGEVGIRGVIVELEGDVDSDGDLDLQQATTNADGFYAFTDLARGDYAVRVASVNFNSGGTLSDSTQTYDIDRRLDATSANLLINDGTDFPLADFGYFRSCGSCKGKVSALRLRYLGGLPNARIQVVGTHGFEKGTVFFDGVVQPNQVYDVEPPPGAKRNNLGVGLRFFLNGVAEANLSTNCSEHVGPGTVVGSSVIVESWDTHGDLVCPAQ